MINVLFVCLGNICRSPMAEGVFKHLVEEAGLTDRINADSAGTDGYNGDDAHPQTLQILKQHSITYHGQARRLTRADLQHFDYILAMDEENLVDIRKLGPGQVRPTLLLDFAPDMGAREVPDPWYNGRFDYVYELILAGTQGLLAHIRKEHGL